MGYDRYNRNDDGSQGGQYRNDNRWSGRDERHDRDRGSYGSGGGGYGYGASAGRDDDRRDGYGRGREGYGAASGDRYGYGGDRGRGYDDRGSGYAARGQWAGREQGRGDGRYRGSYASDGHRFADYNAGERDDRQGRGRDERTDRLEYDADDRGFLARAGDEVRSWFGDEDAERRRERDQRYDEQMARYDERTGDHAYRSWRDTQVSAFDRDYDEYRQENATKFQSEFAAFRTERQGQRDSLTRIQEHQEVVGSDGAHVGTVDKVRDDRIILTKSDVDAGGHHHSIPSRWVQSVDDKVTLRKTKDEAQSAWRDEEARQAMFNDRGQQQQQRYGSDRYGSDAQDDRTRERNRYGASTTTGQALGAGSSTTAGTGVTGTTTAEDRDTNLNRSFPGTY